MSIMKKIKYIIYGIGAVLLLLVTILSGTISGKNSNIKKYKATIAEQEQTINEQRELINKLAAMESVHCEVSITVKNTAVMGSNKSGEISQDAKQVATYLRGEILEAMEESHSSTERKK